MVKSIPSVSVKPSAKFMPSVKSMKCLPGVVCVENYTLFFLVILLGIALYMLFVNAPKKHEMHRDAAHMGHTMSLSPIATRQVDVMTDLYAPPLKMDYGMSMQPPITGDIRGVVPINVKTRGFDNGYQQMGILTRQNGSEDLILPLMGTRIDSRDKFNYFTMSNTGNINTKLPISVAGKSCTSEYGCNEIYDGDNVYVSGYKDVFSVTVYENGTFRYLPVL